MNERIRELLGQAYDEAVPETWTTLSSEQLERIYEKFAELIVRECAEFAEQKYGNWYRINSPDDAPGITIKKHFGVEQ